MYGKFSSPVGVFVLQDAEIASKLLEFSLDNRTHIAYNLAHAN
jgi:hypothetical protein